MLKMLGIENQRE